MSIAGGKVSVRKKTGMETRSRGIMRYELGLA